MKAERFVCAKRTTPVAMMCAVHNEGVFQWSIALLAAMARSSCWIIAGSATAACFFVASLLHLGAIGFIALLS
jgi:hypothetical protein